MSLFLLKEAFWCLIPRLSPREVFIELCIIGFVTAEIGSAKPGTQRQCLVQHTRGLFSQPTSGMYLFTIR